MDAGRMDGGSSAEAREGAQRAVQSLPSSLLTVEGKTFAVVALMQREGWLTRDRRRNVVADVRIQRSWPEGVDTTLPRTELSLLARFIDQHPRAIAFWNLVAARRERRRSEAASASHIVSLEAQLMRSYEPTWDTQEFDEEALRDACPPWPQIRARIDEETAHLVRRPRLTPCMLWLGLRRDLDHWPALDPKRRRAVAHAVFALSSVCWSDWFVREALRRCPELQPELGRTCADSPASESPASEPAVLTPLSQIVERLSLLCAELSRQPTQDAVRELLACASEAAAWEAALPDRVLVAMRELRRNVEALLAQARDPVLAPMLGWLGHEVLDQIEARWSLAALGLDAPALQRLAQDAVHARARLEESLGRCIDSEVALETARDALTALDAELQAAPTLGRRRELEATRLRSMRALLDAEGGQAALEDAVLASASPWSQAFDLTVDYGAVLEAAQSASSAVEPPPSVVEASASRDEAPESSAPPVAVAVCGDLAELLTP